MNNTDIDSVEDAINRRKKREVKHLFRNVFLAITGPNPGSITRFGGVLQDTGIRYMFFLDGFFDRSIQLIQNYRNLQALTTERIPDLYSLQFGSNLRNDVCSCVVRFLNLSINCMFPEAEVGPGLSNVTVINENPIHIEFRIKFQDDPHSFTMHIIEKDIRRQSTGLLGRNIIHTLQMTTFVRDPVFPERMTSCAGDSVAIMAALDKRLSYLELLL